ncbi:ComEC/Rec2 family competence protein [Oceaniglobus indicus]|uniref:ComEC/Rec2 family competence protein n=1 Tax=Oceaniglobus indicus TaxID=2047749 RepID=UPI001F4E7006|nr:ComEC/Rec2 family competence protein [Oceaniglobus indicus]
MASVIDGQRGALFPWVPVCLGIGIGFYFLLPGEPAAPVWAALAGGVAVATAGLLWRGPARHPVVVAIVLVGVGVLVAGLRCWSVGDTVLAFRYYGPVQGRIVAMDRSASDAVRLTLADVVLDDTDPARTPGLVRISLHGDHSGTVPQPGKTVMVTAHLSAPDGPVEPGGFDFQRMAWFRGLGAVGYARSPLLAVEPAGGFVDVARWRMAISARVRAHLPGEVGAFAAAITTGDRSAMSQETLADLRASNLAHLLAISGLHMGLLCSLIFGGVRGVLALFPAVALVWPLKKIAAIAALMAGALYLMLSGGNVATQRAFIMVAVMFVAVLLDRRALTLRAVAVAAIIVLMLRPESLTEPGFQMSFAATTALVGVFRILNGFDGRRMPKVLRPVMAVVISSAVAGAATAPIAAAHFNMVSHFGLLANLVSVPLMGSVVMPGAILAAVLAPFGLDWIGLAVMDPAIRWILGVAHWIATRPGALGHVVAPQAVVLPLMALGALWLILWRGWGRLAGVAPVALGLIFWVQTERPALLVSPSGKLIGVMTPEGRALNKPRGDGFVARSWLENDGDLPVQEEAAERPGFESLGSLSRLRIGDLHVSHLSGRGAAQRLGEACQGANLVILAAVNETDPPTGCEVIDARILRETGGLAFVVSGQTLRRVATRSELGERPWNR